MRAVYSLSSAARHSLGALGEALLIAAILAALLLALAPIYKPADTLVGTQDVGAAPRNSGHITVPDGVFGGTTEATVNPGGDTIWVMAECWQNAQVVYRQYVKVGDDNVATLTLGPTPSWQGGAASCSAEEGTWFKGTRWRVLASTTFEVAG